MQGVSGQPPQLEHQERIAVQGGREEVVDPGDMLAGVRPHRPRSIKLVSRLCEKLIASMGKNHIAAISRLLVFRAIVFISCHKNSRSLSLWVNSCKASKSVYDTVR